MCDCKGLASPVLNIFDWTATIDIGTKKEEQSLFVMT